MRRAQFVNGGVILPDGGTVSERDWRAVEAANILRLQNFGEDNPFGSNKNDIDDGAPGSRSYARTRGAAVADSELARPHNQPPREASPIHGFAETRKGKSFGETIRKFKAYAESADESDRGAIEEELGKIFAAMNGEELRNVLNELGIYSTKTRPEGFAEIRRKIFGEVRPESNRDDDAREREQREYQQP